MSNPETLSQSLREEYHRLDLKIDELKERAFFMRGESGLMLDRNDKIASKVICDEVRRIEISIQMAEAELKTLALKLNGK